MHKDGLINGLPNFFKFRCYISFVFLDWKHFSSLNFKIH